MQPARFQFISQLLKTHSGMALTEDKNYLVESRLQPIARMNGFEGVGELLDHLQRTTNQALLHDVVQAMTTNETMFFRDTKPFERLRSVILPELLPKLPAMQPMRIWSAACSSGQEPYTLSICLQEDAAKLAGRRYEIVASDLCEKVLDKARKGTYSQFEVQRGLPIQLLIKYFAQVEGNQWRVNDRTRENVTFHIHNLMDDCTRFGMFDIIFCRNVLIYFDEDTKRQVLARLAKSLKPTGYLVLGSAETVIGIANNFIMHSDAQGVYTLKS